MQRYLFGVAKRTLSVIGNNPRRFATVGSGLRPGTETRNVTITIAVKKPDFKYLDGIVFMRDAEGSVWRFPETDCEPLSLARIESRLKSAKNSQVLIDEKGIEAKIARLQVESELRKVVMVGNNQAIDVDLNDKIIKTMIDTTRSWLPRDFAFGSRTIKLISDQVHTVSKIKNRFSADAIYEFLFLLVVFGIIFVFILSIIADGGGCGHDC